jgi:virulence factor
MSKGTVSIAIFGCGQQANLVHYPSLASFPDAEIVGVCDLDPARLHATADRWGIPRERRYEARLATDFQEMLKKVKPDGVYVIAQPHVVYDAWRWCLEQKMNLYIEKPMGITIHQARILAWLAEKNGCMTQVSHQRRTVPLLHLVRNQCLEKGPITHGVVEFYKCELFPMTGAGSHMMDDCTHSVDTARWICGGEVTSVQSRCRRVGVPDINWIEATLRFDNGSSCVVLNSWCAGRRVFRVQMHAPGISVDAEVEGKASVYADGDYNGKVYDTKEVAGSSDLFVFGGFRAKSREFIDSLKHGKEVTSSPFRDTVKTMEVCETILAQAHLAQA